VTVDVVAGGDNVDPKTVKIIDPSTGKSVTELVVPGEGKWTVNPTTGAVTFTPEAGFEGDPTPINYGAKDKNGNELAQAEIKIHVKDNGLMDIKAIYWVDGNGNKTLDDGEERIYGATVELLDENGDPVLDANGNPIVTTTKQDGSYEFTGLKKGKYSVRFTLPKSYTDDGYGNVNGDIYPVGSNNQAAAPVICKACEGANDASALGWVSGIMMIIVMAMMILFVRKEERA